MEYPSVFPTLVYDDAGAAIEFLTSAFDAGRHAVYTDGDLVRHAELRFGNGVVMFGTSRADSPATRGRGGGIYIVIDDPDGHCTKARRAGAEIVREPFDTDYGSRDYSAKDPEGNIWHFGTYQPFLFEHSEATSTTTA